jgi:hypothetical protein
MVKRMLADVLWEAANEHLAHDIGEGYEYTCEAIASAAKCAWTTASDYGSEVETWEDFVRSHRAMHFVRALGCDTGRGSQFNDFEWGEARQGVRYMWLLLAMHVAEDEGIEIEVAA